MGQVAAPPYDTLDTAEAAALAKDNPMSFLHINHSEIDLPAGTNLYAEEVYAKAAENFANFAKQGWLVREDRPLMYLYAQTMGPHTQTGLVCCAHIDDYVQDVIKKHEFTRKDKEDDRKAPRCSTTSARCSLPIAMCRPSATRSRPFPNAPPRCMILWMSSTCGTAVACNDPRPS